MAAAAKSTTASPQNISDRETPNQATAIAVARIMKERANLTRSKPTYIHEIDFRKEDAKQWEVLLLPPRPPYNNGMFRLRINFPNDYPFKPPILRLLTPIYHPNIDERGYFCLAILQYDNWKPGTTVESIIQSLIFLLNDPEPERPLRQEIAEQIYKDKQAYINEAIKHTEKNSEKKPADTAG